MTAQSGGAPQVDPVLAELLDHAAQRRGPALERPKRSRFGRLFRRTPLRLAGVEQVQAPGLAAENVTPVPFPNYADEPPVAAAESMARGPLVDLREPVPLEKLGFMPWLSICRLEITFQNGKKGAATGFLTRSGLVATSAHVVLSPEPSFGMAMEIAVTPGYPQPADSGAVQVSHTFFRNAQWGQTQDHFLTTLDYAAIQLPDPVPLLARFGFLDWGIPADLDVRDAFMISGYPGEKQGQWRHGSKIVGEPGEQAVRHSIMTTEGQSGSPMFLLEPGRRIGVFGIHSKASWMLPGANVARRVTNELIADFARWSAGQLAPMS